MSERERVYVYSDGRNSQVFGQAMKKRPTGHTIYGLRKKVMAATLSVLVEGEENKLTTFSTWTIMLGAMKATSFFSSISANLGNSGEAMVDVLGMCTRMSCLMRAMAAATALLRALHQHTTARLSTEKSSVCTGLGTRGENAQLTSARAQLHS